MSCSITECGVEEDQNGFEFPFVGEEDLPLEFEVEYSCFKGEDVPYEEGDSFSINDEEDVIDYRVSNAYRQVLEINKEPFSAAEYEAELKKRGAPFKHGLVNDYLRKFPFEDEDWLPNSEYFLPGKEDDGVNAHELVKRFLKQVRQSNGYDVDCYPPSFGSPFYYRRINKCTEDEYEDVMERTQFAIDKINLETGETYELVQVQHIVFTMTMELFYLFTFTVKKAGSNDDTSVKTVRAMVHVDYRNNCALTLEEWKFKPPVTDIMDREKTKSTCNLVRLKTLASPICVVSALCWITWVSLKKSSTRFHR